MIKTDRNYIGVRFFQANNRMSEKQYSYWTKSSGIKVGDLVVVKVGSEYNVVKVTCVDLQESQKNLACKWIIGRVLDENSDESIKKDREKDAVWNMLQSRAEELEVLEKFNKLAKKDKTMKKLLKKLKKSGQEEGS